MVSQSLQRLIFLLDPRKMFIVEKQTNHITNNNRHQFFWARSSVSMLVQKAPNHSAYAGFKVTI